MEEMQRPGLSQSGNCDRIYGSLCLRGGCRIVCVGGGGGLQGGGSRLDTAHPPPYSFTFIYY